MADNPNALNIAAGVASGASGIAGSIASIINTNKTIQANKQMAEYAYNKDLEMWHRQNEYNSPRSQMERYKEGGLNPNLIYGQGNSGNATSLPKYQAPRQEYNYQAPNLATGIQTYANLTQQQAMIDNLRARTDETNQNIINKGYDSVLKQWDINLKEQGYKKGEQTLKWWEPLLEQKYRKGEADIRYTDTGTEKNKAQTRLIGYSGDIAKVTAANIQTLTNLRIADLKSRILGQNTVTQLNRGRIGLLGSQEGLLQSQIGLNRQNEATSFSNELVNRAREQYLKKEISWYTFTKILQALDRLNVRRGQNLNFMKSFIPTKLGAGETVSNSGEWWQNSTNY